MHKFLNPKNYVRRAFYFVNRHLLKSIETLIAPDLDKQLSHPPIFFLGAPRSGSTLMIQVITDALDLGYISNRHCQWFGAPALAERLFHPTADRPSSDYHSSHGVTKGYYAPAECGQWWYRFFRRQPPYMTLEEVKSRHMRKFRRSVAALTNAFDRPVLFKNLYASLRIQAIAKYLPESLFIITERDEVDNGHSLLEGRMRVYGDYARWWSMEPPNIESLKRLPAHEQVIEQIRQIHRTIAKDLKVSGVPESRCLHLNYDEFCSDPLSAIKACKEFLASHGCEVRQRGSIIPLRFESRREVRIDQNLYREMSDYAHGN